MMSSWETVEKPQELPQDVILRPVSLQTRLRKTSQAEGSITAVAREPVRVRLGWGGDDSIMRYRG
jgi:hypothetical protein